MHYDRIRQSGDAGAAESSWQSRRLQKSTAYMRQGSELEHRAVLEPCENVHHRNGIRTDNKPENLELWAVPEPYGQRVEDLVAWVVQCYPERVAELLAIVDRMSAA